MSRATTSHRPTIPVVIDELYRPVMLRGLPAASRLDHGWHADTDTLWLRFMTPVTPQLYAFAQDIVDQLDITPRLTNSQALIQLLDDRLRALRANHLSHVTVLAGVCATLDAWSPA